jgi:glycine dehydrogenase subunit 2
MKYNPKINEKAAGLPGFALSHPSAPADTVQGNLEVVRLVEDYLCEIAGLDAFTLQPSAGAQGELTGIMLVRACLEDRGNPRKIV